MLLMSFSILSKETNMCYMYYSHARSTSECSVTPGYFEMPSYCIVITRRTYSLVHCVPKLAALHQEH